MLALPSPLNITSCLSDVNLAFLIFAPFSIFIGASNQLGEFESGATAGTVGASKLGGDRWHWNHAGGSGMAQTVSSPGAARPDGAIGTGFSLNFIDWKICFP
jgi:hypothetical protein